jgi:hypothetical protein
MRNDRRITAAAILFILAVGTGIALLLPKVLDQMRTSALLDAIETVKKDVYRAPSDLRDKLLRGLRPISDAAPAFGPEKPNDEPLNLDRIVANKLKFLQCGDMRGCAGGFIKDKNGEVVEVDGCFSCISSFELYRAAMTLDLKVLDRFDWIVLPDSIFWIPMAVQYQRIDI